MARQFEKLSHVVFPVALIIFVLAVSGALLWKARAPKPSLAAPEPAPSGKEPPAEPRKVVLRSSLAGSWYSDDPKVLNKQFDEFFRKADTNTLDNVIALILPHAGYRWSGQTAASALNTTKKKYKRIVVIGPSHGAYMEQILSVTRATHFQTPLGQIPLDTEFADKLLKFPVFQSLPYALRSENSIELELPLLQYHQKDFKLVPIVAGQCSLETISKAGKILRGLVDPDTLVVASSDFVHYGRGHRYVPFTDNIPQRIKELDMGAYEYIAKLDSKGFLEYKRKTGATICGAIPIAVLLSMLDKTAKANLVKYATSGQLTGDFSNSVSYLSVAFTGNWKNLPPVRPRRNKAELTEHDKEQLLTLARKSVIYALEKRKLPNAADLDVTVSPAMQTPRAAFVTLKKNGRLRGCIGDIFPRQPLFKSVIANAVNAAVNDRRFIPVTKEECSSLSIEISALTPPEPVDSYRQIRIGTDGIVLRKDGRSAVFLPQVAPEQGWDLAQTLTQLSLKAGLPADAWKDGASFLVFQANVFGETEK
jgi:AmmeMemoRadiSam system protein B/AmmeMemoRadiSam system protein A